MVLRGLLISCQSTSPNALIYLHYSVFYDFFTIFQLTFQFNLRYSVYFLISIKISDCGHRDFTVKFSLNFQKLVQRKVKIGKQNS